MRFITALLFLSCILSCNALSSNLPEEQDDLDAEQLLLEHDASAATGGAAPLYDINCTTWNELDIERRPLGNGHYRIAYRARFRGQSVIVKLPYYKWADSMEKKRRVFAAEISRIERMQHPSTVRIYGYCLDVTRPSQFGVVVEVLVPLQKAVADASSMDWAQRMSVALSGADMLKFWASYRDSKGHPSPRFFWDFKAVNLATDVERMQLKIVDVESFTYYVDLNEYHHIERCTQRNQCVPHRFAKYQHPILQTISETHCNMETHRCQLLDDKTNVFRLCFIVIKPLLTTSRLVTGRPSSARLRPMVESILERCLDVDHERRLDANQLLEALEELRDSFSVTKLRP